MRLLGIFISLLVWSFSSFWMNEMARGLGLGHAFNCDSGSCSSAGFGEYYRYFANPILVLSGWHFFQYLAGAVFKRQLFSIGIFLPLVLLSIALSLFVPWIAQYTSLAILPMIAFGDIIREIFVDNRMWQ